jgi:hypothetical protein
MYKTVLNFSIVVFLFFAFAFTAQAQQDTHSDAHHETTADGGRVNEPKEIN